MTAGVVGLLAAPLLVRGLLAVAPAFYGELAAFTIDRTIVLAALGLCTVVGLAVALPPLIEVLRVNLRDTLQEEGRSGTQGRRTIWMRQLLIGAETAVCAVLLVGALLLLRTFVNLVNVDTGVDSTGVITARMSIQGPQYDDCRASDSILRGRRRPARTVAVDRIGGGRREPSRRARIEPAGDVSRSGDQPTSRS